MTFRALVLCTLQLCVLQVAGLAKVTFEVHTDSAKAVMEALQTRDLGRAQALRIASMKGNQGIIRKLNEFKIPATAESFANALVAASRDQTVVSPNETAFYFASVKAHAIKITNLIRRIEEDPDAFRLSVQERVALFVPENADLRLEGQLVAGGDGGGYSFGDTVFFLNLGFEDEFEPAKIGLTHELYHAVQGAMTVNAPGKQPKSCIDATELFRDVYAEGSATYVEDYARLGESSVPRAQQMFADLNNGIKHVQDSATLLELSVIGLRVDRPVPFDDIYSLGFYGRAILYNIGYVMSKAIAENDGARGLAAYLQRPVYQFVLRYTKLPRYGMDTEHPKLGAHTIREAERLARKCK